MISRDAAADLLAPHMGLLGEPFPAAWERWEQFGREWPEIRPHLSARARANMMHDWAAARARTIFAGMEPSVRLVEAHGFLLLVIDDRVHIRMKKFRKGSLKTSGIPTQQSIQFAAQQPLSTPFPGMEITNLVLGYQLNVFQTEIERMAITCSTLNRRHWVLEVPAPGGASVLERPTAPEGPASPSVRSKRDQEEREEKGS